MSELITQEKSAGTDGLHLLIEKRWKGLLKLRKLLGDSTISYENNGGYELFGPAQKELARACVSKMGHFNDLVADIVSNKEVFATSNQKIKQFGFNKVGSLIENRFEAQIDPGKMMGALLTKAQACGVQVYNNCEVQNLQEEGSSVILKTSQGVFRCKRVLLSNNAFVSALLPEIAVEPGRGQVLVTSRIPSLKVKGSFHYDEGYYYFRNIDGRLLLGGGRNLDFEGEKTTDFGTTELVQQRLLQLLNEVIIPGQTFTIEHKWSGIMAFGPRLFPVLKMARPNIFVAVRCNGMGIAIGSLTGQEAGEMLLNSL